MGTVAAIDPDDLRPLPYCRVCGKSAVTHGPQCYARPMPAWYLNGVRAAIARGAARKVKP